MSKFFVHCCHSDVDFIRSDKDKIFFKAIENNRYGLRKTVSKQLKILKR